MTNTDDLPSWAVQPRQPEVRLGASAPEPVEPAPPVHQPRQGGRWIRRALLALVGLMALAGMAALGYWFAQRSDDSSTEAAGPTTVTATTVPVETVDGGTDTDDGDGGGDAAAGDDTAETTAPSTTLPSTTAMVDGEEVDNRDGAIRYSVLKGGQVYLRGTVPNEEVGNEIASRAEAVVGPGNVFNEYEIDPSSPMNVAGPLYVEDVVLFGFNSVEIEPAFLPILELGTSLLTQFPTVTITVVTRTDAVGSEDVNLEVSQLRGQAVVDYWVDKGVDPSRLSVDARGESEATESDNPEVVALDRRAEFIIAGLLG